MVRRNNPKHKCKRKSRQTIGPSFSKDVLKWLISVFIDNQIDTDELTSLVDQLFLVKRTRGTAEAIRWSKSLRSDIMSLLCQTSDLSKLRQQPRRSIPRRLRFLRRVEPSLVRIYIRLLLTVTYTTRTFTLPVEPDFSSIVGDPKTNLDLSRYYSRAKGFWRALGHRHVNAKPPSAVRFSKFHLSTRTSPSGGNALAASLYERCSSLIDGILEPLKILGGKKLEKILDSLGSLPVVNDVQNDNSVTTKILDILTNFGWRKAIKSPCTRRLSAIPDKEGKTREVAILDYWSQTVLRPLHRYLFRCLKQIKQDCTFNQGSFLQKLRPNPGHSYYSFDLVKATNRFPEVLSQVLMEPKFGVTYVRAWATLMVGLPFEYKQKYYSYSVGTPMGAYTSWNSFTLTHHFVIYCCCCDLGISWHDANYVLLGDDIVIHDDDLAQAYRAAMEDLGVEINFSKSHISPYCYEFAKRVVHNGVELTPYPVNSLWENRNNPIFLMSTISLEVNKGWNPLRGVPLAVDKFFEIRKYPGRFRSKTLKRVSLAFLIQEAIGRRMTAKDSVESMLRSLSYDHLIPQFEEAFDAQNSTYGWDLYVRLFRAGTYLAFRENFERQVANSYLGEMPVELACFLTSDLVNRGFPELDYLEVLHSLPLSGVYDELTRSYSRILKDTYSLDYFNLGDWPMTMKALALPLGDELFYEKPKNLRPRVAGVLSDVLLHLLAGCNSNPNLLWYGTGRAVSKQELFEACPRIGDVWFRQE